jgi:membrane protease YdiL (CAAX protease family)
MLSVVSPAAIAQHLLAVFLVAAGPVWDFFDTRKLKANSSSAARLGYYRRTILWLWTASCVAVWTTGWAALFTLRGLGIQAAWLAAHRWAWWATAALVTLVVLIQLVLPVVQVTLKYRKRPHLEPRQLEPLRFFLPATVLERRWFAALSVTAGFCEELLFRGFLLRYLHTWPLHLGLAWTVVIATVVFGMHHLYQGRSGVISTSLGGLVFAAILLVTGSLLAGMIFHTLADLSLLLYWRPRTLRSAVEQQT